MSEWKETLLEKLADEITVGFVGSMTEEYQESGIPFFRSKNIEPYRINWDDIRFINQEFHKKIKKSALTPGDVVIVRTGKPGAACLIPDTIKEANCSDLVIVRPSSKLDRHFLVYYLNSIAVRHINSYLVGAVQQHFNIGAARQLKIKLPAIKEQKQIADVLTSLDNKIENLRQQNQTLEQIAQTLFKHWFIDFEFPNDNGEPYKSSGGEMKPSELGDIPAGWRVGKLGNLIDVRDGTHDSPKQSENGFHLITSKHLKKEGIDFDSAYLISEQDYLEVNKRSKVDTYDILLSMIGTVGLLYFVLDKEINFAIKNIGLFKTSKKPDYPEFIYLFLTSNYGQSYFRTRLAGTTQSYITLGSLRDMPIIIPSIENLTKFKITVQLIFEKYYLNNQQIQTLTKTRDTLLPKLMSGQIRIEEEKTTNA